MKICDSIRSIERAGFVLEAEDDNLAVEPFSELSIHQINWLQQHKAEILTELATVYDLDRHAAEKQAAIRYWRFMHNGVEVDIASGATLADAMKLLGVESGDEFELIIERSGQDDCASLTEDEFTQLLDATVEGLNLSRGRLLNLLADDDILGIRQGEINAATVRTDAETWEKQEPVIEAGGPQADGGIIRLGSYNPVMCADCEHYNPDPIGHGGIGSCKVGGPPRGTMPAYPNAVRLCDDFKLIDCATSNGR